MSQKIFSFLFIIFVFFAGFLFFNNKENSSIQHAKIAGITLNVEVASTPEAQAQGLSGRTGLAENKGMLFVFAEPGQYAFWMKDMNFPIDMIWINENFKVIYIQKNAEPASYPETFGPAVNAKYVLEVVAGFADKNNLKEGDSALFGD